MTGTFHSEQDGYIQAASVPPPPPITSDIPPAAATWIEMATAALFSAANMGDPEDNAIAQEGHGKREAMAGEAASQFPAGDEQQAQGMDQLAQQLPQMLSSAAGSLTGALGGAMQPFMQLPQQLAQSAQQLMQSGMGGLQQAGAIGPEDFAATGFDDAFDGGGAGGGAGDLGGGGGGSAGGGGGIGGGTSPMAMLGPPATPSSTTSTAPTAGRVAAGPPVAAATAAHPPTAMGGMGGMPMMPHGMGGVGGAGGKEGQAATKRVSVPSVRNGAPVQGRITMPPPSPVVTKSTDDTRKLATRRIVIPSDSLEKAENAPNKRPGN